MVRNLYSQPDFPIFQNRMYDSRDQARGCPRGDIRIVEDLTTGMVHNAAFDPALVDYDSAYQNEQANSAMFQDHLRRVMGLVNTHMPGTLVEVGCGKGHFLEELQAAGRDVTGFDPTYEGDNPVVKRAYFSKGIGYSGDGLVLRHVLEHIRDPHDFLVQLAEANGGQGLIYIEVPCFDWICANTAWYDIFYEHVNYFRMRDFHAMFGRLVHAGHSFGGQYLSIIGDLSTLRAPQYDERTRVEMRGDFQAQLAIDVAETPDALTVWGGGSKGVIFSLLRERAGRPVSAVIDINPAKQNRFLPATGLEVNAPDDVIPGLPPGAPLLVMNPNYMAEIKSLSGDRFQYMSLTHD